MEEFTKSHSDQTDKTIEQIQTNLEKVLNTSLTSLGGELAALSNKFVNDYSPLTEELRKVIQISKRVQNV